jgi:hypothetical protein
MDQGVSGRTIGHYRILDLQAKAEYARLDAAAATR